MEAAELLVIPEREIDVNALEVGPAVTAAVEDAVERLVDAVVLVRPELRLRLRAHPRVHRRRHQPGTERTQYPVDPLGIAVEDIGEARQVRPGTVRLQLDDVQNQLVGPGQLVDLDLGGEGAGHREQDLVGDRPDRERRAIDDHVLQLDPDAFEEAEIMSHSRVPVRLRPLSSSRSRKYRMIST